ncbi:hypothetical protein HNR42_002484 [Deinobacterium chartae]|uniref:ArsR family transcriptional regulator n=1 Tax=Deinobacterium chartae TaxID=521158 RepID=A0A841I3U4_9DEIO|nr:hypothetical protein [Deinobacterium chartae]MBB6099048.1 hypothetical protein [Deinobacterium chartae]
MKSGHATRPLRVNDVRAARALLDPASVRYLLPFLGRENTAARAAAQLGVPVRLMTHHIARLRRLGLLSLLGERTRGQRAIKVYRAVSDTFFVPFLASSDETLGAGIRRIEARHYEQFVEHLARAVAQVAPPEAWGVHIFRNARGDVVFDPVADLPGWNPAATDIPAVVLGFPTLRLEAEDAKALQRELFELYARYASRSGSRSYLLRLGLTPLEP